ncbi:MAG TPA: ABC transporter permease [Stellaceae bacterium]|nr:ABC transporter permease [Stellaceae bacterium]
MRQVLRGWAVQKRVLGALFMREIQTRWGRKNLGFAWLFFEPLIFAFPVLAMWSALRAPFEHGMALMPFLWSGYLPLLLFRHVTGHAMRAVSVNGALLYHQVITPLDVIVGRCGLEAMGNLAAIAFSFFVFYMLGVVDWPVNVPLFMMGNLFMAWWAFAVALIVAAASERTEIVEHVWPPISYMYMPISGFFFLAEWIPTPVRKVALTVMPSIHAYEMIRGGLFGSRIQVFYDTKYLAEVLAVLTLIGLWLVRDVRYYLELE